MIPEFVLAKSGHPSDIWLNSGAPPVSYLSILGYPHRKPLAY